MLDASMTARFGECLVWRGIAAKVRYLPMRLLTNVAEYRLAPE